MANDPLGARVVMLSTIALCALGVARPLLDLLGRNVELFVAHGSTAADVVLFAVGITLIAPVLAAAVVLLVAKVHRPVAAALHTLVITVLVASFVLVTVRVADSQGVVNGWLVVLVAFAVGAGVAALYWRSGAVRRVLQVAAIAAPLTAIAFLFFTPANNILAPAEDAASALAVGEDAPPIVMIVFDEFPVASLLDADGNVDAKAFPSFGRLAKDATFFNNATAVHARTMEAVPAIASGARSLPESLPTAADHPTSIFALLADSYRMHVTEPVTALCPPEACGSGEKTASKLGQWRSLLRDLAIVEAHVVAPADMEGSLPPLNEGWKNFSKAATKGAPTSRQGFLEQGRNKRDRWPSIYRRFVRKVRAEQTPALHFIHVGGLPHYPWTHLPDGREYQAAPIEGSGLAGVVGIDKGQRWSTNEWQVAHAYQRHLLQVQFVDTLVGELLDKLETEGMYDDAMVVVTADHGASFTPGGPLRALSRENLGEVGSVPLFIKAPGQHDGTTSSVPAESVDILPSILDLLNVEPPEGLDGLSVFGDEINQRTERRMTEISRGTDLTFGPERLNGPPVERKLSIFGGRDVLDTFRLAPEGTESLLGTSAPAAQAAAGARVEIEDAAAYEDVDLEAPTLPALLAGTLAADGYREPPAVAVAVNGTIAAVTQADPPSETGVYPFRTLLPPDDFRDGRNDIEIFVVDDRGQMAAVPVS